MKPISHTRSAMRELEIITGSADLLAALNFQGEQVLTVVPDCLGISLTYLQEGLTFTLAASSEEFAVFDALHRSIGPACTGVVQAHAMSRFTQDQLLSEDCWQIFARSVTDNGIRSSLTLPILTEGVVTGSVDLYAATARAFAGHHHELAAIFRAWAPGAVTNADLAFTTRDAADQAAQRLRGMSAIDQAVGVLAERGRVSPAAAREQLHDAAVRAGVSEAELARVFLDDGVAPP